MWILVLIVFLNSHPTLIEIGRYDRMDVCFENREELVEKIGRPIRNYQTICIQTVAE